MGVEPRGLYERFGHVAVLRGCSLEVGDGELLALLGPSGCGKSTLLRIIAGFLEPDRGEVLFGGRSVLGVPVRHLQIAFIMENWGLYPHLDVAENIAYPLRVRRVADAPRRERTRQVAELLKIGHLLSRRTTEPSGGQRQRVAIARALVRDDASILLNEPSSDFRSIEYL